MLIVAINGSSHEEGNTATLLRAALKAIEGPGVVTAFLQVSRALSELKQPFCVCCSNPCLGNCYKGTKLAEMFDLLRRSDAIIMGSPVYFGTISAQLKAFWDKTRLLRKEKALINVVGAGISTGGSRFGGQESTIRAIHEIMLTHGMTVVGDGYYYDDAGHQGACAQIPVEQDEDAINRATILAKRVLEVSTATKKLRLPFIKENCGENAAG